MLVHILSGIISAVIVSVLFLSVPDRYLCALSICPWTYKDKISFIHIDKYLCALSICPGTDILAEVRPIDMKFAWW